MRMFHVNIWYIKFRILKQVITLKEVEEEEDDDDDVTPDKFREGWVLA